MDAAEHRDGDRVHAFARDQGVQSLLPRCAGEQNGEEGGEIEADDGEDDEPRESRDPLPELEYAEIEQEDGAFDTDVRGRVEEVDRELDLQDFPRRQSGVLSVRGRRALPRRGPNTHLEISRDHVRHWEVPDMTPLEEVHICHVSVSRHVLSGLRRTQEPTCPYISQRSSRY